MAVAGEGIPAGTTVDGVLGGNQIQLSQPVTVTATTLLSFSNEEIAFFPDQSNVNVNNVLGPALSIGDDANVGDRSSNNAFEGFYVDDIIVGFAERGEMVTNAASNQSFFGINTPTGSQIYPEQVLEGEYQLEVRRGAEFAEIGRASCRERV